MERGKGPKSCGRWIKGRLTGRENDEKIKHVGSLRWEGLRGICADVWKFETGKMGDQ